MHTVGQFLCKNVLYLCASAFTLFFCSQIGIVEGATIHEYRDTLSDSRPATSSNHTIQFKTTGGIPPSGSIRFEPEPGEFTIPASNFDIDNIELYVSTTSTYVQRSATGTPSATQDGIAVTPGASGSIELTLNSTVGIPAGAYVRLLIGEHTRNATGTDVGIINPSATGTNNFYIETVGTTTSRVRGLVAIVEAVSVPDVDTRETAAPVRFNGAPSGTLSGTTLTVQMSLETDEFARCRYSTASGTPYFSMTSEFSSAFATIHLKNISVATSTSYTFFIRCIDDEGNANLDDYTIAFAIPVYPPGEPGDEGDGEDVGSGGGTGSGSGDNSGSTGGSSSGGSSGSGGGGGGSGSGGGTSGTSGSDSGGFEGSTNPYQSGDGLVIINGYAFPRSEVYVLVDGEVAERVTADSEGEFSVTLDAIARGVYTFGVYAIDQNKTKSSTFSTTFTITGARGSTLSNINVMPSIKVTPDPVDPESTVTFSGFAIPDATITIENQSDKSSAGLKTFTTTSDGNGAWSYELSTAGFKTGTYKVRAKAKQDLGVSTNFSDFTYYGVGEKAAGPQTSDLNRDGKVNLIDFSILLFWWNSAGGNSNPPADINQDGKVSLTDFSILIFNWTG